MAANQTEVLSIPADPADVQQHCSVPAPFLTANTSALSSAAAVRLSAEPPHPTTPSGSLGTCLYVSLGFSPIALGG